MKKVDNKGFSLLEVLIAIAIASIILTAIFSVFNYTTKSYSTTRKNINIQEEAQYASNFIYEILIESEDVKSSSTISSASLGSKTCSVFTVVTNVYEKDVNTGKNTAKKKHNFFVYIGDSKKMYYSSVLSENELTNEWIAQNVRDITDDSKLLAENVASCVFKEGKVLEGEPVEYSLQFQDDSSTYTVKNKAYSRNSKIKEPTAEPTTGPTTVPGP